MRLHAHVETESRDCDSTYTRTRLERPTAEETASTFGDIDFRERVALSVMSIYACTQGTLTVTENGVDWGESTEEGYRSAQVTWCEDDCDDERPTFRDATAEAAGY
jgi:hypothetical protein